MTCVMYIWVSLALKLRLFVLFLVMFVYSVHLRLEFCYFVI